jgi:hypothetical protein
LPTLKTELGTGRELGAACSALEGESGSALQTKFRLLRILLLAAGTLHRCDLLVLSAQIGRIF